MKNKFILGLILGIFLVGMVSAGITGYLARGDSLSTTGVTATLESVNRFGDAVVSVATPTGTESVQVAAGKTARTSEGVEITASNLRAGTLFRKARGEISVVPADESLAVAKIATRTGAVTGHTHLSDPYVITEEIDILPGQIQGALGGNKMPLPVIYGEGTVLIYDNNWYDEDSKTWKTTKFKQLDLIVVCNKNVKFDLAVGGEYALGLSYADGLEYQIIKEGINNVNPQASGNIKGEYLLSIQEPFTDVNNDFVDDEGIQKIGISVTCARVEPTLHQFSLDY
ncbi:MAG: hypothetical protein Q8O84_04885 [Nanoarchaeota archaeon]|nr:hypothetical protein [Nanoarchaeota archaeon]